mgnify:CR=1 FL=1
MEHDRIEYRLKNANEGDVKKVWRYQSWESYSPSEQKRRTLVATLKKVHDVEHLRTVVEMSKTGGGFDTDTYCAPGSWEAMLDRVDAVNSGGFGRPKSQRPDQHLQRVLDLASGPGQPALLTAAQAAATVSAQAVLDQRPVDPVELGDVGHRAERHKVEQDAQVGLAPAMGGEPATGTQQPAQCQH